MARQDVAASDGADGLVRPARRLWHASPLANIPVPPTSPFRQSPFRQEPSTGQRPGPHHRLRFTGSVHN